MWKKKQKNNNLNWFGPDCFTNQNYCIEIKNKYWIYKLKYIYFLSICKNMINNKLI